MKKAAVLWGSILVIVLFVVIGGGSFWVFHKATSNPAAKYKGISGLFDVNGVIPSGSTITLFAKPARQNSSFTPFASGLSPHDEGYWQFPKAMDGKSYEIQAGLLQNGNVIYLTSPIEVTAPAINQVLTFDVPLAHPAGTAAISGIVGIDGYIPPNSTLTLEGRKAGEGSFSVVTKNISARDQQSITYATAVAGQAYEVKALLYDGNGKLIGTSAVLSLVAPAYNEELDLNSTAQPPATPTSLPTNTPMPTPTAAPATVVTVIPQPTSTPMPTPTPMVVGNISGVIRFNGQTPPNSRIVLFERVSGTQNYQVAVNNITPADGTNWQWIQGVAGTSYDLIAILKQRQNDGTDKDISNSNTLTLDAPAANEIFTINSGFLLPAPGASGGVSCGNYDSGTQTWTAGVSFNSVNGAQSYWYQVGTTNGGIELTNFTQNATNNPTQSFNLQFKNGVTYYARYAYANVPNLMGNDPQFSAFSSTSPLRCSN